jgi:hypothetical protein
MSYKALSTGSDVLYQMHHYSTSYSRFLQLLPHEEKNKGLNYPKWKRDDEYQEANRSFGEAWRALRTPSFTVSRRGRLSFHRMRDGEPQSGPPELEYNWLRQVLNSEIDLELSDHLGKLLPGPVKSVRAKSDG